MDSNVEPKTFLYSWLGKNHGKTPNYNIRAAGIKNRQRFLCELSVEGFFYVGAGNSTSKKDSQTNAARDFIQYLIRSNQLDPALVPPQILSSSHFNDTDVTPGSSSNDFQMSTKPVFRSGEGPSDVGQNYKTRYGHIPDKMSFPMDSVNVADAEALDVNSAIHGNWNIDNAKGRLHQYIQTNKIVTDYKYSTIGPSHARSFKAEMGFYVRELGRKIFASETGSTKMTASKSCALSLVRQLYHLKVIEAYTGISKKKKEAQTPAFPVAIDPKLIESVDSILRKLQITPAHDFHRTNKSQDDPSGSSQSVSLIATSVRKCEEAAADPEYEKSKGNRILSWAPPIQNWNPWIASNIDEGPMATASLDSLSELFMKSYKETQQSNEEYQKLLRQRSQLPVYSKRAHLMNYISEYPVILVKGETGCGKTTQICQFILDDYLLSGQGALCNIVVTQPRRISAVSIADRVATERGEEIGESVGYSVRFESCLPRPYGSILFCTVGVLLRKLESGLRGVSHVIVDEIHERDLNSDFLLIVLRDMLSVYTDLRVILMSATMDHKLFQTYFNDCPVVEIKGRTFPVETYFLEDVVEKLHFQPSQESMRIVKRKRLENPEDDGTSSCDQNLNILHPNSPYSEATKQTMSKLDEKDINFELLSSLLIHIKESGVPGSVLVFLPGWNNIFSAMRYLQEHPSIASSFKILPLHSQLPRSDQHQVFLNFPPPITKVILSTNIAESSVTIDDVVFVIDACKGKTKLFTSHNNMTTFATVWASKSNIVQRRGRAGRVRPGYCYHLCSKARFQALEETTTPEILRTPLHEIALTIKLLRLGDIGHFLSKALQPPPVDAVIEAQALLFDLKCLTEESELTPLGTILAKLPLDPRIGKMLVLGTIMSVADPIATVAAQSSNLSEIFVFGPTNRRLAPQQRGFAARKHSDHFALLNAFQQWCAVHFKRGENAEAEFCQQRLLSLPALKTTLDAKTQIIKVLQQCGFPEELLNPFMIDFRENNSSLDTIAGVLCSGLYPNICYHLDKRKVLTTEAKSALIHKASVNCSILGLNFPFPFFVFGEKIRTRAVSCKQMTMITPLHLLLFGSKKVEMVNDCVRLDNWIDLKMPPTHAATVVALRSAIENLISRFAESPQTTYPFSETDAELIHVVMDLCRLSSSKSNNFKETGHSNQETPPEEDKEHRSFDNIQSPEISIKQENVSFIEDNENGAEQDGVNQQDSNFLEENPEFSSSEPNRKYFRGTMGQRISNQSYGNPRSDAPFPQTTYNCYNRGQPFGFNRVPNSRSPNYRRFRSLAPRRGRYRSYSRPWY